MCDFSRYGILSDEWIALEASLPAQASTVSSYAQLRDSNNADREALAAQGFALLAPRLLTQDYNIPTRDGAAIQARTYRLQPDDEAALAKNLASPTDGTLPVYVHFHGGGFHVGTLASEDGICARIAAATGAAVLNVNYRHTPEHVYPTAFHDAADAFLWLHAHASELGVDPSRVVVGGISAGAQLTVSLLVARHLALPGWEELARLPAPVGQVLMTPPVFHCDCKERRLLDEGLAEGVKGGSYEQNKDAPVLPAWKIRYYIDLLKVPAPVDAKDYVLNPGNIPVNRVAGLPPATFGISGADPLRDEGLLFAKMLSEQGVPTNVNVFSGMPHAFRKYGAKLSESAHWDAVMHRGVEWALSRPVAGKFEIKDK